jgi:hypothetical protein
MSEVLSTVSFGGIHLLLRRRRRQPVVEFKCVIERSTSLLDVTAPKSEPLQAYR